MDGVPFTLDDGKCYKCDKEPPLVSGQFVTLIYNQPENQDFAGLDDTFENVTGRQVKDEYRIEHKLIDRKWKGKLLTKLKTCDSGNCSKLYYEYMVGRDVNLMKLRSPFFLATYGFGLFQTSIQLTKTELLRGITLTSLSGRLRSTYNKNFEEEQLTRFSMTEYISRVCNSMLTSVMLQERSSSETTLTSYLNEIKTNLDEHKKDLLLILFHVYFALGVQFYDTFAHNNLSCDNVIIENPYANNVFIRYDYVMENGVTKTFYSPHFIRIKDCENSFSLNAKTLFQNDFAAFNKYRLPERTILPIETSDTQEHQGDTFVYEAPRTIGQTLTEAKKNTSKKAATLAKSALGKVKSAGSHIVPTSVKRGVSKVQKATRNFLDTVPGGKECKENFRDGILSMPRQTWNYDNQKDLSLIHDLAGKLESIDPLFATQLNGVAVGGSVKTVANKLFNLLHAYDESANKPDVRMIGGVLNLQPSNEFSFENKRQMLS